MNDAVGDLNKLVDVDHLLSTLIIMIKQSLNDFPDLKEEQMLNSQLLEIKRKQAFISKQILAVIKKESGIKAPSEETYKKISDLLTEVNVEKKKALKSEKVITLASCAMGTVAEFLP